MSIGLVSGEVPTRSGETARSRFGHRGGTETEY